MYRRVGDGDGGGDGIGRKELVGRDREGDEELTCEDKGMED